MTERQVRSKARVEAHGEGFTAQREVNAMPDLAKQETERTDSRFLDIKHRDRCDLVFPQPISPLEG